MLLQFIYGMVGQWGRALITWGLENPSILALIFLLWATMLFWGKSQLRRLERNTSALVIARARQLVGEGQSLEVHEFYERLYPEWAQMVRRTSFFIPHHWELWPLPALPSIVGDRIGFSPEWVKKLLQENSFKVR